MSPRSQPHHVLQQNGLESSLLYRSVYCIFSDVHRDSSPSIRVFADLEQRFAGRRVGPSSRNEDEIVLSCMLFGDVTETDFRGKSVTIGVCVLLAIAAVLVVFLCRERLEVHLWQAGRRLRPKRHGVVHQAQAISESMVNTRYVGQLLMAGAGRVGQAILPEVVPAAKIVNFVSKFAVSFEERLDSPTRHLAGTVIGLNKPEVQSIEPLGEEALLEKLRKYRVTHEGAPSQSRVKRTHLLIPRIDLEVVVQMSRDLGQDVEQDECVPLSSRECLQPVRGDNEHTRPGLWGISSLTSRQSGNSSGTPSDTVHFLRASPTLNLASSSKSSESGPSKDNHGKMTAAREKLSRPFRCLGFQFLISVRSFGRIS